MRSAIVTSSAISIALAILLMPAAPALAETAPQATKIPQGVKAGPAGRVGSLSPDEQRRAARGRARAAAAEKAAREKAELAATAGPVEPKTVNAKTVDAKAVDAKAIEPKTAEPKAADAKAAGTRAGDAKTAEVGPAPAVVTHRSVAVAEPAPRAERPAGAEFRPEAAPRRTARLHRVRRSRFAAGEPRIGDRIPDDVDLRSLPRGAGPLREIGRRLPYERVAEDMRPPVPYAPAPMPWGYRPAYAPYPYYRQGW